MNNLNKQVDPKYANQYVYKQTKHKQSKTTSANSPIATT